MRRAPGRVNASAQPMDAAASRKIRFPRPGASPGGEGLAPLYLRGMRRDLLRTARVLVVLAAGFFGWAGPAAASGGGLTPAQAEAARAWKGRACTPTGCGPAPAATAGSVLGFGAAAGGAAWASRRRGRATRRI